MEKPYQRRAGLASCYPPAMADVDYAIVGGGVIGRAMALELAKRKPGADVVVIERCPKDRIENQSTRNSGVIHAGIYYRASERPLKAELCVRGNAMLYEFCREHGVAHAQTGKLVVATTERQEEYVRGVLAIAEDNGVPGVRMLSGEEAMKLEPNLRVRSALYAPTSGVIDSAGYLQALTRTAPAHSLYATEVVGLQWTGCAFAIETQCQGKRETFLARYLVNAAGIHADEVARILNPESEFHLVPARGEAAKFYQSRRPELALGGHNIYPAPVGFYKDGSLADASFAEHQRLLEAGDVTETLGIHLTPTLNEDGSLAKTVTIGPAIQTGMGKEDVARSLYPPEHYWRSVSEFFPGLVPDDVELHQAGIQARMAGQLDWYIRPDAKHPQCLHMLGIDSPGMTASLAIAQHAGAVLHASAS